MQKKNKTSLLADLIFVVVATSFLCINKERSKQLLALVTSDYVESFSPTSSDSALVSMRTSNWLFEETKVTKWTVEENKRFENALAFFDKDTPDRWKNVAAMIPGKTVSDVIKQYKELVEDIRDIEAGLIPIPGYDINNSFRFEWLSDQSYMGFKEIHSSSGKSNGSTRFSDPERKKGVPWTVEEHRQFLLGLKKYGKGDWRNISRNLVTTRTPTQVASHAQKYFMRQVSVGKDKRRSSIHDVTTADLSETMTVPPEKNIFPSAEKSNSMFGYKWSNWECV